MLGDSFAVLASFGYTAWRFQRAALGESSGILHSRARVVREEGVELSRTSVESV
jgi:ABC-type polysaccharide/polyol phosphate export permease